VTWYGLSVFSLVYVLAVAAPGPGVAAIIARSLGHGLRGAPAFIGGFIVGDLIWFTFAATGLAMLAQSAYAVFLVVKYAGVAYLLYLAFRLWTAPAKAIDASSDISRERPWRLFLGSLALTLGNPKTMIFFLAVLPTVVELKSLLRNRGRHPGHSAHSAGRLCLWREPGPSSFLQATDRPMGPAWDWSCHGFGCSGRRHAITI
jgi:threonine/homoserine/homoserine lactone efflux protein